MRDSDETELISEETVLDEFLTGTPNNGVLVATVLGESGAGKSHLVRWANAQIPDQADRHVIYLQKAETSLKDVVEKLLLDQTDPEFDELRRRVSGLGSGITTDEMEHKILAELAEALRTAQAETPQGKALVGENGLRLFFTDPLFEKHLLREGSFIKRRSEHALRGRAADEPDVPLEFTVDELPTDIADYADIGEAALATQKLFRRVVASETMQTEAVRLLNEVLDIAVTKAANLAVGDISQAFKRIREKLVGREIVLLIEDIALIQGVRRDLLDAIVEVGVVQGVEKYATVRTLIAVTPGYYVGSLPGTFRRRAEATSPIYVVDVDLDSAGADEDDLVDFVGRYLNAARVGKTDLEAASPQVPNRCTRCPVRPDCHDAFGASRQDYGLYPYNRAAILRAVRACAERDRGRVHFNPRKVLSRAVRHVLTDNITGIQNGAFPPSDFLAEESAEMNLPQLPVGIRAKIEADFDEDEAGRLITLLTFWGRLGTTQIDPGILRAFSHQPISVSSSVEDEATVRDLTPAPPADDIPLSVQRQVDAIEKWSQGHVLPQAIARDLRSIIREALLARIDWFDVVIKDPDAATLSKAIPNNATSVSIEGATENLALGLEPVVRLKRSAQTATLFIGLAYIKEGFAQRAGDALSRLDALVIGSVGEAKKRILTELAVDDTSLQGAAASLIRGAVACGTLPGKPKQLDLINACLWRTASVDREDADARAPQWVQAYSDYMRTRDQAVTRLLNGLGAAQGSGAVHVVDVSRLAAIVKKAAERVEAGHEYDVPAWCEDSERKLKVLSRAAALQIDHWRNLVERIRRHLPGSVSFVETVDAITEAARVGQGHGLVKVADLGRLNDLNAEARGWDDRSIRLVERLVADGQSSTGLDLIRIAGSATGTDLPKIATYLESSATWVDAGLREVESSASQVANLDVEIEKTIVRWLELVKEPTNE